MRISTMVFQRPDNGVTWLLDSLCDLEANDAIVFPRSDFRGEKELLSALAEAEPAFSDVNHFLSESVSPPCPFRSLTNALVAPEPRERRD